MTPRVARVGVSLALLYALVALVTSALSSRPVLPLFDGFAPPVPYNWVSPPAEAAANNSPPKGTEREVPLGQEGTEATNVSTEDGQMIVGLDKGSVASLPPETAARVTVAPLDPATLGPLPPGLRPVSNAYRVMLRYVPSQAEIARLAVKGTVAMTAAQAGDRLLYSSDGAQWQEREFRPFGQDNGVFSELETGGYFLVASSTLAQNSPGPVSRNVVLLGLVAVLPILGAALVLRLPSPVPVSTGRPVRRPPAKRKPSAARKKASRGARKSRKRRRK